MMLKATTLLLEWFLTGWLELCSIASVKNDLPARLRAWRIHRAQSQRALADAVGVSVGAVSHWEAGRSSPTHDNVRAVAAALGLSLSRFYGRLPAVR